MSGQTFGWDVVLVLVTLVGLFTAIITPIIKLTKSITRLTVTVENVDKRLNEDSDETKAAFESVNAHDKRQDDTLAKHEIRIHSLEDYNELMRR